MDEQHLQRVDGHVPLVPRRRSGLYPGRQRESACRLEFQPVRYRQLDIDLRADGWRPLAGALVHEPWVTAVAVEGEGVVVSTTRAGDLAVAVPRIAAELGVRLREVRALDDSLDSLFRELTR